MKQIIYSFCIILLKNKKKKLKLDCFVSKKEIKLKFLNLFKKKNNNNN